MARSPVVMPVHHGEGCLVELCGRVLNPAGEADDTGGQTEKP